jgi:cytochrome c
MKSSTALACSLILFTPLILADDLGFDGDIVEADCAAMSPWFNCRDITTLNPNDTNPTVQSILRGYEYMHHTASSLGPFGTVKYPDGSPYATAVTACSSCHFTGGHVPFGTPVYQSPARYTALPYFRPMGYKRDLEDSIIDCFRNCMNADRSPSKEDPVMRDLVAYIQWVADGIIVPNYPTTPLPPEAGPNLPVLASVGAYNNAGTRADPVRGAGLYGSECAECHDADPGKLDQAGLDPNLDPTGLGQYRIGDDRPDVPALWGLRDGHSTAAAFYRNGVLGAYIKTHMPFVPFGKPRVILSDQDSLDIAAYINAPDKDAQRTKGQADRMFCFNDPDGVPAALRKQADWKVGCEYRNEFDAAEPFTGDQIRNGPWAAITSWRSAEVARRRSATTPVLAPVATSDPVTLDNDDAFPTAQNTALTIDVLANDTHPSSLLLTVAEVTRVFPDGATAANNGDGTVTYTPPTGYLGEGGFVYRAQDENGLWSNYATALVAVGAEVPPPPAQVDLSIQKFSATSNVRLSRNEAVVCRLEVRNNSAVSVPSAGYGATLVGVRNGQMVHTATIQVSDPPGGGSTAFSFPSYRPAAAGTIAWTVTVTDGDGNPNNDVARATTTVRQ